MKDKLILSIRIEKNEYFNFKEKGNFTLRCPSCDMPIVIELNGLPEDATISPVVDYKYEWQRGEEEQELYRYETNNSP